MSKATIVIEDHPTGQVSFSVSFNGELDRTSRAHLIARIATVEVKRVVEQEFNCSAVFSEKNPFVH